jgi:hypothetical protein
MAYTFTPVTGIQNGADGTHYLNTASRADNGIRVVGSSSTVGPNPDTTSSPFAVKGAFVDWSTVAQATITADYDTNAGTVVIKTTGTNTAHTFDYTMADRDGNILGTAAGVGSAATTITISANWCTMGFQLRAVDRTTGTKSEAYFAPSSITPHAN